MSVKIRLRRDGQKKRPFYHVVAADERRARNGRFIEELGYYNPMVPKDVESILVLKDDRVKYWLSVGAQPTETAAYLLEKKGLFTRTARKTAVAPVAAADAAPAPVAEAPVTETVAETPAAETPAEESVTETPSEASE